MTYNSENGATEYGPCPYNTNYKSTTFVDGVFFIQLPSNVSLLNEFMCGPLKTHYAESVKMAMALHYTHILWNAVSAGDMVMDGSCTISVLELFPITVMYFLVVIFHIRATSSPLSALVFMSQILVYTIRLNAPLHMYIVNSVTGFPHVALQLLLVLCGIWSLDFFRSVIPPFCVSSRIKTVHALALEYLVAFYPILF